jgi:hypothetical protein
LAATVRITSHHTATDDASAADVAAGTIFFKIVGDDDTNTSSVPPTGTSLIKNMRVYIFAAPIHTIGNLKFYWTGTAVSGIDVKGKTSTTYVNPVAQGTTALTAVTSMYTYTAGAPLSIDGTFTTGTDTAPKFISDFLVLQVVTTAATVAASVGLGSLVTRFDET